MAEEYICEDSAPSADSMSLCSCAANLCGEQETFSSFDAQLGLLQAVLYGGHGSAGFCIGLAARKIKIFYCTGIKCFSNVSAVSRGDTLITAYKPIQC